MLHLARMLGEIRSKGWTSRVVGSVAFDDHPLHDRGYVAKELSAGRRLFAPDLEQGFPKLLGCEFGHEFAANVRKDVKLKRTGPIGPLLRGPRRAPLFNDLLGSGPECRDLLTTVSENGIQTLVVQTLNRQSKCPAAANPKVG